MAAVVSLKDVAGEMDVCPQEWRAFLNRKTGEIWTHQGDFGDFDDEEEEDAEISKLEEIEGSADWVALPGKDDWDEYRVMEEFCEGLPEGMARTRLQDAIHGKGAFRRFKDMIHTVEVAEQWYAFRQGELAEFVGEWLKGEGIEYRE